VVDTILVGALGANFLVQDLGQLAPFLGVLVSIVLNHDPMFLWCKVILWRLIVKYEDALTGFTLKVRIDISPPLCF